MSGDLGSLVISLSADIARFQEDMGKSAKIANDTAKQISGAFDGVNSAITKIGTLMTAVAGGLGFKHLIDSAADWSIKARDMALTMGTTTEEASIMEVALHSLGISEETAKKAALALAKDLEDGGSKFKKWGIAVTDANGALKTTPALMADVNAKLLSMQAGTDRNVIAMDLYGRKWKDVQDLLRYLPESFKEAAETAERLNLVVGSEGVAQGMEYKKNLREIELVAESLSIQLGNKLMPAVISVGSSLAGGGTSGAALFGEGLAACIVWVQELGVRLGATIDTIALFGKTVINMDNDILHLNFGKLKEEAAAYSAELARINKDEAAVIADIQKKATAKPTASLPPTGNTVDTSELGKHNNENMNAAQMKELAYLKAFEEKKAAIIKAGADLETELNKEAYEWGLKDLQSYLDDKHRLSVVAMDAEIAAKKKELADAQAMTTTPVTDKNGVVNDSKTASAQYEGMKKVEDAEKSLIDLEGKRAVLIAQNANETKNAIYDQERSYKNIGIELMNLTGDTVGAQKATDNLYLSSKAWKQLEIEAAKSGSDGAKEAVANSLKLIEVKEKLAAINKALAGSEDAATLASMNGEWQKYYDIQVAILKNKIEQAQLKGDPTGALTKQLLDAQIEASGKLSDNWVKGFKDISKAWGDTAKNMQDVGKECANALQKGFSDIFFDGLQGKFKTLSDYISSFLSSVERAVSDMISKQLVSNLMSSMGSWFSASAKGNVFATSGLSGYSNTIVSQPTFFPFARGVGLMGEAGPEAVMPLTRTKDGNLGVRTDTVEGAQAPEMKVIINNNTDSKVTAKQSDDGMTLEVMVEQIESSLTKRMNRGSGLAPYMDSRYGRRG
jgi:hypothetical protein